MKKAVVAIVGLMITILAVVGCSRSQSQGAPTQLAVSTAPIGLGATATNVPAMPTAIPSTKGATPDTTATWIVEANATLSAIGTTVAGQEGGQPLFVLATARALGLFITPVQVTLTQTPLPFPVATELVDVTWSSTPQVQYLFADPEDLAKARQAYERYFEFISFRTGPPSDDIENELAEYMVESDHLKNPRSCFRSDVVSQIRRLAHMGKYVHIAPYGELVWDNKFYLNIGFRIELSMGWQTNAQVELVDIQSGEVLNRRDIIPVLSSPEMVYDDDSKRWLLQDDYSGFYCQWLDLLEW